MKVRNLVSKVTEWGTWSGLREWTRGILHFGVGLAAWAVLHPLYRDDETVTWSLIVVGGAFSLAEGARIAVSKSRGTVWFTRFLKWLNHGFAERLFVRESEKFGFTTTFQTILGCTLAWMLCPRWICALSGLLLGLCDPLAKFGKHCQIYQFPNRKSLGGALFGLAGGAVGCALIVLVHQFIPLFPAHFGVGHIAAVYAVGLVSAPVLELIGGKWDNFLIVSGSAFLMTLASLYVPA